VSTRRAFLGMMGGDLLVVPRSVRAQPVQTVPVVGILRDRPPGPFGAIKAVQEGLRSLGYVQGAAKQLSMDLLIRDVHYATDFDELIRAAMQARSQALRQLGSPVIEQNAKRISEVTLQHKLPAISPFRNFTESGGLMSYGLDQATYYQEACVYVDKILEGAKPADLPIEQPTRFLFIINLETAKALRLSLPQSLVARADRVIE
jgi:putative tryptophan/tyrosine transport system substrate-binding protein